jgi:FlaA1/EpsC-like NDP-sugar epimerase
VKKGKSTRVTGSTNGSASKVLAGYKLATDTPLYLVGAFNENVTVLSQQIRALNLAWAMVEESTVPTRTDARLKLAIIGAGFTGLTLAAALPRKRTALDITIFEERDTLLPLQQGSDSRWLHPQI